ncbi:MAG TPA: hypothetical protein VLK65_02365 [Vicinamibacteria bacterium]|nr:hypothetical protein [Vicinamibacteria bacterium]
MNQDDRRLVFESAMDDYRAGLHGLAARTLRSLVEDGSEDPLHLSYCGLLASTAEGLIDEGVAMCRRAVALDGKRMSQLHLNLARALSVDGRRREAIDALWRGLAAHPGEPQLRRELQHLVPRARPVFRSLPRRHAFNKYAGIARTVGGRLWVTFVPRIRRVSLGKGGPR